MNFVVCEGGDNKWKWVVINYPTTKNKIKKKKKKEQTKERKERGSIISKYQKIGIKNWKKKKEVSGAHKYLMGVK